MRRIVFIAIGIGILIAILSSLLFLHGHSTSGNAGLTPPALYVRVSSSLMRYPFYAKYVIYVREGTSTSYTYFTLECNGKDMCILMTNSGPSSYTLSLTKNGDYYVMCSIIKTVPMSKPVTVTNVINSTSGSPLQILFYKSGFSGIYNAITIALFKGHKVSTNTYNATYAGYNVTLTIFEKSGLYLPKYLKIVSKNSIVIMKLVKFLDMYNPLDFDRVFKLCTE